MIPPQIIIVVLAHNEERRIGACLASLPYDAPRVSVHVVVNGSSDGTAAIARASGPPVTVHDWPAGGKARSWNRIMLDTPGITGDFYVFVDGDAVAMPGAVAALTEALAAHPAVNAASAMPQNGRRAARYRAEMELYHGLFGDLYALSGNFVARLRASGVRLPEDVIGDDSLIGTLAKTDLGPAADWDDTRVMPCAAAGFLAEPVRLRSPASWAMQAKRMTNYAQRRFQNQMIGEIMREAGPAGLPPHLADRYGEWLPRFSPRRHPVWWWFDQRALSRMRAAARPAG